MSIQVKYQPLLALANELGVKVTKAAPEGTALKVEAIAKTQYDRDRIFAKLKEISGENPADIKLDIKTEITEYYAIHKVAAGENLSVIAKKYLGESGKYMEIAKFNNISNPDLIKVGQEIKIPPKP